MTVFEGVIKHAVSSGSRGAGRLLKVRCSGFDDRGKIKEPQRFHMDDASLEDFLGEAATKAGLAGVTVDPALAGIMRDYWAADGESFLHVGQRLAREYYATFKIRRDQAVLVPRGREPGLPPVHANASNMLSWRITPKTGRNDFTAVEAQYLDREKASIETVKVEVESDRESSDALNRLRAMSADEDQAKGKAKARKDEANDKAGEGTVEMDLTPHAQAEAMLILTDTRPGVDGTYRIATRTHKASRSAGGRTSLKIKQPSGGAGKDTR